MSTVMTVVAVRMALTSVTRAVMPDTPCSTVTKLALVCSTHIQIEDGFILRVAIYTKNLSWASISAEIRD